MSIKSLSIFILLSFCSLWASKPELYKAISDENHEKVQELIKDGANVNKKIFKQMTPLFFASKIGNEKIVHSLIIAGANPNTFSYNLYTPLMIASKNGHLSIIKLLLDAHADATIINSYGVNALMFAAQGKDLSVIKHLVNELSIDSQDNEGNTPLMHCIIAGDNDKILKELIAHGANTTIINNSGFTADNMAIKLERQKIYEVFHPKPQNENTKNNKK